MIVVDTSVAIKWLLTLEEKYVKEARNLLDSHLSEKEKIVVPELMFYEVGNALATKTQIPSVSITHLLKKIYNFNLSIYHPTIEDVVVSTKFAKKYNSTVYDMLYAVAAKENGVVLVTADEKFIEKTGFKFVKHIKDI